MHTKIQLDRDGASKDTGATVERCARARARIRDMPARQPRLSGPRARYRGKLRDRPIVITLTPEGHAALAAGVRRRRLSRSDYIEELLRRAESSVRVTPADA